MIRPTRGCPFCGRADELSVEFVGSSRPVGFMVVCGECGAEGPYKKTETYAVQAWDYRHGDEEKKEDD